MEEGGIEIEPGFTVLCGVKEGATFLGLDIAKCMSSDDVFKIMKDRLKKELDKISKANYPLQAKLFFYEVGVLAKFRWWFAIYENITISSVVELQRMAFRAFRSWHASFKDKLTGEVFTSQRAYGIEDLRNTHRASRGIALLNGMKAEDPMTKEAYLSKATVPPLHNKDTDLHKLIAKVCQKEATDPNDYSTKGGIKREARAHTAMAEQKGRKQLKGFGWCWTLPPFDEQDESLLKKVMRGLDEKELAWGFRALCDKLDTKAERARKMRTSQDRSTTLCPLCNRFSQDLNHVLNRCPVALAEGRYTTRHDAVLRAIADRIALANNEKGPIFKLWADLAGYNQPEKYPSGITDDLKSGYRPDIMITIREGNKEKLVIIELTCPFEDAIERSHQRKVDKYTSLKNAILTKNYYSSVDLHCIEVGSRGFIANTLKEISPYLTVSKRGQPTTKSFMVGLGKISLRHSRRIYLSRDNTKHNGNGNLQ